LWDTASGKELQTLRGHTDKLESVAFSLDGRQVLTGSFDKTARLWETATGQQRCTFKGHLGRVMSAAFSPDGRRVLTASADGTTRVWDAYSGRELCQIISFDDSTWEVIDGAGRFDAAKGGEIDGLYGAAGNEFIPLKELKGNYYDPGLLAKYMGFNKEPLRQVGGG
jgi:WD40 repeat protein